MIRRATVADVEPLARGFIEGVEDYPAFAPAGCTAPSFEAEVEHLRSSLADDRVWCLVSESGGELVGQITVLPAAIAPHPLPDTKSGTSPISSSGVTSGAAGSLWATSSTIRRPG